MNVFLDENSLEHWSFLYNSLHVSLLSLFQFLGGHFTVDTCLFFFLASYSQYRSEDGRASSATRPSSAGSGQTYTPTVTSTPTPTPTRTTSSPSNNAPNKTGKSHWQSEKVIQRHYKGHLLSSSVLSCCLTLVCVADSLLFNKIDERQRLARERRGEREKQNGVYSLTVSVTESRT